jgi:hypothetical protein
MISEHECHPTLYHTAHPCFPTLPPSPHIHQAEHKTKTLFKLLSNSERLLCQTHKDVCQLKLLANSNTAEYPTTSWNCVLPINHTAILESCCQGAPIGTYGDPNFGNPACYQYCNISSSAFANMTVQDCLAASPGLGNATVVCFEPTTGVPKSSGSRHGASMSLLAVLGGTATSAVLAMNM